MATLWWDIRIREERGCFVGFSPQGCACFYTEKVCGVCSVV